MPKEKPLTEQQLVARLRSRYEQDGGNGPAGCVVPQVRDAAGFDAKRTIDALGFHFWPSRGLLIDGYECKSSRSDWNAELANPVKAEVFCRMVDRFWIVAGRADLVLDAELPPRWGLLVPRGDGLVQVRPAQLLHQTENGSLPPSFDRSFLIAILRQAYKISRITPEEIEAAYQQGFAEGKEHRRGMSANYHEMYKALRAEVSEFEDGLGYPIRGYSYRHDLDPKAVGQAVKAIVDGEFQERGYRNRLHQMGEQARRLADELAVQVAAIDAVGGGD